MLPTSRLCSPHTFKPSTEEAEAEGRGRWISVTLRLSGLRSEFHDSQLHGKTLSQKQTNKQRKQRIKRYLFLSSSYLHTEFRISHIFMLATILLVNIYLPELLRCEAAEGIQELWKEQAVGGAFGHNWSGHSQLENLSKSLLPT